MFVMYKQEAEGVFLNQSKFTSKTRIACKTPSLFPWCSAAFPLFPFSAAPSIASEAKG